MQRNHNKLHSSDEKRSKTSNARKNNSTRQRRSWRRDLSIAVIPVVLAALIPLIAVYVHSRFTRPGPHIEVDSLDVRDQETASKSGTIRIDVLLRNTGNMLAVIKGVQIRFEQSVAIPVCDPEGAITPTAFYGTRVPLHPRPGWTADVSVSQEEPPDSADHFVIELHAPRIVTDTVYLDRLNLQLLYDKDASAVEAGHVTFSLPANIDNSEVWTKNSSRQLESNDYRNRTYGTHYPEYSTCLIAHSRAARRVLALPGYRSSALQKVAASISECCALKVPTYRRVVIFTLCDDPRAKNPVAKPASVDDTCSIFNVGPSDGDKIDHITWSTWDLRHAVGKGDWDVDNCKPTCTAGKSRSYAVIVRLSQPKSDGAPDEYVWNRAAFTFPRKSPYKYSSFTMNSILSWSTS
jgi:hypothetical protein